MTVQTHVIETVPLFHVAEWRCLRTLRARNQQDRDLFSERERAHLHFLRWLCQTGRLVI